MTQIATTAATMGGKAISAGGAGKSHGTKPGAAGDFAALVAGLGASGDDSAMVEPDGFALAEDSAANSGTGTDGDGDQSKTGAPVILDLALGAAAQSAMADMVVPPPIQLVGQATSPVPAGSDGDALLGALGSATRTGLTRTLRADAGIAPAVADGQTPLDAAAPGDAPTTGTTSTGQAASAMLPSRFAAVADRVSPIAGRKSVRTDAAVTLPLAEAASSTPDQDTVPLPVPGKQAQIGVAAIPTAIPAAIAAARSAGKASDTGVPTAVGTTDALRPAVSRPFAPQASPLAPDDTVAPQQAMPLSIDTAMQATISPAVTGDGRQRPVGASSPLPEQGLAQLQPAITAGPFNAGTTSTREAASGVPAAQIPAVAVQAEATPAPAPGQAQAAYAAVQPIMSALHRASAGIEVKAGKVTGQVNTGQVNTGEARTGEAKAGDPAPMSIATGDGARRNGGGASGGASGGESSGGTLASDSGTSAASVSVDALPGGLQFADIVQGLPPIAQSRIGLVGDAPVVAGPADVGATLQGQVIDMAVGGQWIDRMAKEITALASGTGHSRFQLSPPNLGRIQIDVWQGEGGGKVQLLTETDEAARQLRDGQSSLQADARLAALQLNSITIDRSSGSFDTPRDQSNPQQTMRQHQPGSDQGSQTGTQSSQTGSQGGSQQNGQQNAQAGLQGGNSNGQGKSSQRRDVLNHQADTVNQQGGSTGREGDRLVRYA